LASALESWDSGALCHYILMVFRLWIPASVVWKNLEIIGQCSADISHYYKALQIIKNNRERFNFGDIITRKYSLKDINIAYASMLAGTDIKPAVVA
jgi:Zn-dependent alcohol dehydrogenase